MRILLVEDDPTTSKSIEMMLTHANLNVYTTDLGEEGIDLAKLYDYDLILLATGYKLDYPFIDSSLLNWQGDAPRLYLNVFHPHYDNLFMMGMIEAAGLGWEGRNEQAELVALYLKRRAEGHAAAARLEETKRERAGETLDGGYRYLKLSRMAYYVHKDSYRAEVANQRRALQEQ